MNFYELAYLISSKLTLEDAKNFSEQIIDWIKKEGGMVAEVKNPKRIKLAYEIKKETEGFLVSLNFHLEPEKLENVVKKMKSEGQILRSLIFAKKAPKEKELPKIPKIKKEEKVALEDIEKRLEEILGET